MEPRKLKITEKNVRRFFGTLLCPLRIGKPAVFLSDGKIYHTSRVVRLHEQTSECIHFETTDAHYHLSTGPVPTASVCRLPVMLDACA